MIDGILSWLKAMIFNKICYKKSIIILGKEKKTDEGLLRGEEVSRRSSDL